MHLRSFAENFTQELITFHTMWLLLRKHGCQVFNKTLFNRSLFPFYFFLGLAGRRQEWCVLVGQWALWPAGRIRNQPHCTDSGTISVTNTTGSNVVSHGHVRCDDDVLLITRVFPVVLVFCQQGCVWTELFLPDPVQWGRHGCRWRTVWQAGPGKFWWFIRPHDYFCISR